MCKLSSSRLTVYWLYTRRHGPGVLITSKRASHRVLEKKGTIESNEAPRKKAFLSGLIPLLYLLLFTLLCYTIESSYLAIPCLSVKAYSLLIPYMPLSSPIKYTYYTYTHLPPLTNQKIHLTIYILWCFA